MELDDLKNQLKDKLATDQPERSDADIALLLHKRTNSVVEKLKRSLLFEIKFSIPFIVLFACIGLFSKDHTFKIYFSFFTFFIIGFLILLIYLYKRTSRLGGTLLPVKHNLQTIVNIIEEFIKRCFQLTMIMIPLCLAFVLFLEIRYKETSTLSAKFAAGHLNTMWKQVIFLVVYAGITTVGMYYFAKWYLRKMYGKYVDQLKECIKELSEE